MSFLFSCRRGERVLTIDEKNGFSEASDSDFFVTRANSPFERTTESSLTKSFVAPYLMPWAPAALVPIIPPKVQRLELAGSIGKNFCRCRRCSLSVERITPG